MFGAHASRFYLYVLAGIIAVVFIAQALNVHLTLVQELTFLAVAMLTSKGPAGVTGAGFVTLAATIVVSAWEGDLDRNRLQSELAIDTGRRGALALHPEKRGNPMSQSLQTTARGPGRSGSGIPPSRCRRTAGLALAVAALALSAVALAQEPDLSQVPPYQPQAHVVGRLRIAGSPLKGLIPALVAGFETVQPDAIVSTNFQTESEGALGMIYAGVSDVAPMGDDAKITDQMPFYNTFGYTPTEVSVATGCYNQRGCLYAWAIMVNKDNPLAHLSMQQLDEIFGSERSGAWTVGGPQHAILFTAKYARSARSNIRTWGQLGLRGSWAHKQIQTYGYVAPGFAVSFERHVMHWSDKWNPNFQEVVEQKEATPDADGKKVWSERMYEAISKDKYAIGWGALMHVDGTCVNPDGSKCEPYPNVRILAISATPDGPAIPLTAANVRNRSYPLSRDAYIYVNKPPGRPLDPGVREFVRFVLSREGQEIIDKHGVYNPLPESYIETQLKKID